MSNVVTFSAAAFVLQFPAFAAYNTAHPGSLQYYFDDATMFLDNSEGAKIEPLRRARLLNLIVAHLGQLGGILTPAGAGSTASQVGRVSSGSEGSVSATFSMESAGSNSAYWLQTQYGAMYWQATAQYRTFRYATRRC